MNRELERANISLYRISDGLCGLALALCFCPSYGESCNMCDFCLAALGLQFNMLRLMPTEFQIIVIYGSLRNSLKNRELKPIGS